MQTGFYKISVIVILFVIILINPHIALAVTITLSNVPSTINTESFSVGVNINGANEGTNYLRIDLYKDSTPSYFGETNNGNTWYSGSDGLNYFPIVISQSGSVNATVQGRFGSDFSEYGGPGNYKLKIRRYTNSGNQANNDTQTPADIQISVVFPSPTPTPSSSPTPTPTATPRTSSTPGPTLQPTSSPKSSPLPSPSPKKSSPSPSAKLNSPSPDPSEDVLGITDEVVPSVTPQESTASAHLSVPNNLPFGFLLISFGILLSGGAGFLAYKKQLQINSPS